MKQLFFLLTKLTPTVLSLFFAQLVSAQSETSVSGSVCGVIVQNFNGGSGSFTSKSLYTPNSVEDSAFYYNTRRGYWTEVGSAGRERTTANGAVPPSVPRYVSVYSPAYKNPNPAGIFDVGFRYIVPNPDVDEFNVQLERIVIENGVAINGEVAISGFKRFRDFSTPAAYTDPTNPLHNGFQGDVCIRLIDEDITAGANTFYRVSIVYKIRGGSTFTAFENFSLGNTEQTTLPVNFIGLLAKRNGNEAELRWDVVDEKDVKEYKVEKSVNGIEFRTIGSVGISGKNIYSFIDQQAENEAAYYRVKSIDIDGSYKYSPIFRLNANGNSFSGELKVYPTPANTDITVQHKKLGAQASIAILTADGQLVKTIRTVSGSSHTPINLSGLTSGIYLLRLNDGEGKIETTKFVKR